MSNNVSETLAPPKPEKEEYIIPNYKFTKTLGSGTFGKVIAATHIPSG
jgi:hypothetical protein